MKNKLVKYFKNNTTYLKFCNRKDIKIHNIKIHDKGSIKILYSIIKKVKEI
jgi:hypothetical protein